MKRIYLVMALVFVLSLGNGCSNDKVSNTSNANNTETSKEDMKKAVQSEETVLEGKNIDFEGISFVIPGGQKKWN